MKYTNFEFIVGIGNHSIYHNAQAEVYEVRGLRVDSVDRDILLENDILIEAPRLFRAFIDAFNLMHALNQAD